MSLPRAVSDQQENYSNRVPILASQVDRNMAILSLERGLKFEALAVSTEAYSPSPSLLSPGVGNEVLRPISTTLDKNKAWRSEVCAISTRKWPRTN